LATGDNKQFVLTDAAWYKVQTYIEQGLRLPITIEAIKEWLSSSDVLTDDITRDLESLTSTYAGIASHCGDWKNDIYPKTVDLANHIVEYNQQVPDLYAALKDTLTQLQTAIDAKDEEAIADRKKDFQDLLSDRITAAQQYQSQADTVAKAIGEFVTVTQSDQASLKTLKDDFDTKYGAESADVTTLTAELTTEQANLKSAQDDAAEDAIIMKTTIAYVWVPIFGMIAAGTVIGVYAERMKEAVQRMTVARAKIAEIGGEIARDQSLMYVVNFGSTSVESVLQHLNDALPVVEQIRDAWKSIADGLEKLSQLLEADTTKAVQDIKTSDIDAASNDWADIAQKANTFRANAYITVHDNAA
jgi:hypothetical protein